MYKEDLVLNNLQWLICHKTKPKSYIYIYSHRTNTLGKGYSPSSYGKIVGQNRFFSHGEATSLGEGKL